MVKKILVTGGKGYVGGRICEYLASNGDYRVVATSRNSKDTLQLKNVEVKAVDYYNDDFETLLEDVDAIIHLAALNEIDCVKYPYEAIDFNVKMTLKWLNAAEKVGVRKFIYFSTIHVYGPGIIGEIKELERATPRHPYGITHKAAEDYVLASRLKTNLDAISLRMSNSFGQPVSTSVNRWTLLVNDLCKNVINTNELKLRSDGLQLRDFITLTDVVRAVKHFLDLEKSQTQDGLFNLCSGQSMSVYDMTKRIAENFEILFNIKPVIKRLEPTEREIINSYFSIEKLNNLGFSLKGNVDQELQNMLIFCMKNFKDQN
jgi:UDP-glucose 4-epimerase